jgi:hypothetical protein
MQIFISPTQQHLVFVADNGDGYLDGLFHFSLIDHKFTNLLENTTIIL